MAATTGEDNTAVWGEKSLLLGRIPDPETLAPAEMRAFFEEILPFMDEPILTRRQMFLREVPTIPAWDISRKLYIANLDVAAIKAATSTTDGNTRTSFGDLSAIMYMSPGHGGSGVIRKTLRSRRVRRKGPLNLP